MRILNDADIDRVPISRLMDAISKFVVADFEGKTTAPPRQDVSFPAGKIVFTSGGYKQLAGFRAYETFLSEKRTGQDQVVAAWDTETCAFKGACFGTRLGALRTGALGGIAVGALTPQSVSTCAVIGTGLQAETQMLAILAQREFREFRVYSRSQENRERFVARLRVVTVANVTAFDDAQAATADAEVVILATNSTASVVEAAWLRNAVHVTTVGFKFKGAHELPLDLVDENWLLVSDSPQQIQEHAEQHMLFGHPRWGDVRHLGEMILRGRPAVPNRSLYLSAGLAGTEVVALDAALSF